ncbi:signal transduction histidine kinase/ActR/RegA family two-component response regulator [Sphingomonas zeicaulis]|uniref:response regulator n=1 Tax=Sphingomonas zeicaulis TaxID=1632740 RepID=UPI003D260F41
MTPHISERALILAPQGRDAEVAAAILSEAGFASVACTSIPHLVGEMGLGAGFALVTEEQLRTADLHALSRWIQAQPEWSDFPFILLTLRGGGLERNPAAGRYLDMLGSVTFLERPFHPTTLVSLAQSARRARRRQYDARSRLEELHGLTAELEQRVEQRTAERQIALKQLHEAQKLETLGQLTGGVAHDFNNLLTPIIGALDLLQRRFDGEDARVQRWIANALQSGDRAKTLVQRLLGFARRQELQNRPVDICGLIDGMRDLIISSLGSTIELRLDCTADLPPAMADPNQLELAILNLSVNARDAMPGGGLLTIKSDRAEVDEASGIDLAPGTYIRLALRDNGTGMDVETLTRAVEPFFSTKEVGRGTGLGLSMVHGLMAQLGGAFTLESELGRGTCATLYMPVTTSGGSPDAQVARPPQARSDMPLSILIVDDEELVRNGTAEMLRSLGHQVIEAGGGAEALRTLMTTSDIDLVITDYKMPRMDGAELADRIRADRPDMPLLLISGYTGAADPIADMPRLNKPFGLAELAEALRQVTERQEELARSEQAVFEHIVTDE